MNKVSNSIWLNMPLLIAANFLGYLGIFLVIPNFTPYLLEIFLLSPFTIGIIAGIWPTLVVSTSFLFGAISDRIGFTKAIQIGHAVCAIAFLTMATSVHLTVFIVGVVLFGIGKALLDCSFSALLIQQDSPDRNEHNFRVRSIFLNLASVIGPVSGIYLYAWKMNSIFYVAAIFFLLGGLILSFYHNGISISEMPTRRINLKQTLQPLRNKHLRFWLGSSLTVIICLAIFESMLPLITSTHLAFPSFGYLLALNSLTVLTVQFIIVHTKPQFTEKNAIILGFLGYATGFLLFIHPGPFGIMLIIGTLLFSSAEALLFPLIEVTLTKIAPADSKATYFGFGEFEQLGFLIGPIFGGWIFNYFGYGWMFFACTLLCGYGLLLILKLYRSMTIL